MKFKNIKHGIPFQREFELEGANIDLRNDFCLYKITTAQRLWSCFSNPIKQIYAM